MYKIASWVFSNIKKYLKQEIKIELKEIDSSTLKQIINSQCPTILEIGCNEGTHTNWFLELFPKANIYCFEPDPRAIIQFKQNINNNRVRLFNTAISDEDAEVDFYLSSGSPPGAKIIDRDWDLSSSIKKPKIHLTEFPWCKFNGMVKVKATKLDSWAKQESINTIDFIWADVQGAEKELIAGATNILSRTKYFYSEYSNKELYEGQISLAKILEMLPDFKIFKLYANDVLLINKTLF